MSAFQMIKKLGPFKTALLIFVLLALFILIAEKPGSRSAEKIQAGQPLLFPRLRVEEVTHLTLTSPNVPPLELRKTNEGWMAKEAPALPEKVEVFLEAIQHLKNEALVSRNPHKQSLFGVDEAQGTHVQLWRNSRQLVNFYWGKTAELSSQYIRLEDSNNVFQATPLLPPLN